MKFRTILIDPPWQYGVWDKGSKNCVFNEKTNIAVSLPYQSMPAERIAGLPIGALADTNCELYLWATQKYLPNAFGLLGAWGFKYCTTLTWCKTPMGTGQGGVYCPTTEFLLHGRRGKMPSVKRINSTWFHTKRQARHSQKPASFRAMIESVTHEPRLEIFARYEGALDFEQWVSVGNEITGNDVATDLKALSLQDSNITESQSTTLQ